MLHIEQNRCSPVSVDDRAFLVRLINIIMTVMVTSLPSELNESALSLDVRQLTAVPTTPR